MCFCCQSIGDIRKWLANTIFLIAHFSLALKNKSIVFYVRLGLLSSGMLFLIVLLSNKQMSILREIYNRFLYNIKRCTIM